MEKKILNTLKLTNAFFVLITLGFYLSVYNGHVYNITKVPPPKRINSTLGPPPENTTKPAPKLPNGRCDNCFHWNFTEVIAPRLDLCTMQNKSRMVDLVIIITTKHENRANRALMREMYNGSQWQNHTIRMIFVLGEHPAKNQTEEKLLKSENGVHHDMLQTSVRGSYWNMTRMLYGGYDWIHRKCKNAKFILKISDDTIINVPGTLHVLDLKGFTELRDVVFGHCQHSPSRPFRHPKTHKWYVDVKTYPFEWYPPYCSGAGMFTSFNTMSELLKEAGNVAFPNPHDDVFVGTNMKLSGHCHCHVNGYSFFGYVGPKFIKIAQDTHNDCKGITALGPFMGAHFHGVSPSDMRMFWLKRHCYENQINHGYLSQLTCPRKGTCQSDFYHVDTTSDNTGTTRSPVPKTPATTRPTKTP